MASDDDGRPIPEAVEAYRKADRLDPFGFSGWIGREPHGAAKSDCGTVRDGVFAEQVVELFGDLAAAVERRAVAGGRVVREPARHRVRRRALRAAARVRPARRHRARHRRGPVAGATRSPVARPARSSSRRCGRRWSPTSPPTSPTAASTTTSTSSSIRRSGGSSTRSTASGMADDTIVVFTSDHGDLLGAHGGLQQKWCNAFDEATRVPLLVKGPGVAPVAGGRHRADQPRRPDPHADGPRRHRRRTGRGRGGRSTTPRPSRCPAATSAGSSPDRPPPSRSPRRSTS